MNITKAISEMEKLRDLMLFDATTGEDIQYETLSQENRDLFNAAGVCIKALNRVLELEAELADERHRHDRYVDFELAEAEELQKLREERRWIPVTERLPEQGQEVIVYDGGVLKPKVFCYLFWNKDYDNWARVTHWMPLPEAPKEAE